MPFGWGIVSTGTHPDVKIAPAMAAADGGELVGVYSRDQHRAEAFAQKHGARAAYSQLGDLLKDPRVDGVFVSSPNALHAEHVVQAAEAGKHVLCEKPMATTIADAVRMLQACRRAGVTLGIAFNLRQHPAYIRARELVAAGTLGRIVLAQAQWAFGVRGRDGSPPRTPLTQWWDTPELIGGASTMMGTGVHSVDLLRLVLGAEVDEITAVTDGQTTARPLEHERHRQRDHRIPGSAAAELRGRDRGLPARGRHRRPASSDRPGRAARRGGHAGDDRVGAHAPEREDRARRAVAREPEL